VRDAAAFGVPDSAGVEQVWAAIVATPPIEDAVLDAFCDAAPPGMAPLVILQLEALPRNANGKLQRDVLTAMAARMSEQDAEG
jgi:acyl-CoA synthetase (AMP-forming)/AMP-acid ligase II